MTRMDYKQEADSDHDAIYLNDQGQLPYILSYCNSLHTVRWWVDASYAVHLDMKSHTGGCMSLGTGALWNFKEA